MTVGRELHQRPSHFLKVRREPGSRTSGSCVITRVLNLEAGCRGQPLPRIYRLFANILMPRSIDDLWTAT